jgi:hypothetical protein
VCVRGNLYISNALRTLINIFTVMSSEQSHQKLWDTHSHAPVCIIIQLKFQYKDSCLVNMFIERQQIFEAIMSLFGLSFKERTSERGKWLFSPKAVTRSWLLLPLWSLWPFASSQSITLHFWKKSRWKQETGKRGTRTCFLTLATRKGRASIPAE